MRDKIPDIINKNGETPITKVLDANEFEIALKKKLLEEYNEVVNSSSKEELKEELADMLEVINALAKLNGFTLDDIKNTAEEKSLKKGAFENKIFLKYVIRK